MLKMLPDGHMNRAKGSVLVEHTLPFDTVTHIISSRLLDDENFKMKFMPTVSDTMSDFLRSFMSAGPNTHTLHMRFEVK